MALAGICPHCLARDLLGEGDAPPVPVVPAAQAARWEPRSPAPGPTGVPFGKYLKVERLADQEEAESWKAWDTEAGRWVLLHLFNPKPSGPEAGPHSGHFLARSDLGAVHETGEVEGHPYVALQWVDPANPLSSQALSGPPGLPPARGAAQDRLGPYRLLKKLGEGGMGSVYLAEEEPGGRKVALKLLPKALRGGDDSALKRFRREANAAMRLFHPHLVRGYAVGEDRGFPYYVMEYCEGETLESLLRREKRLEWTRVLEIGQGIASALAHAHARGFVHRDVKPANILVTKEGVPKLLDLGISKSREELETSFRTEPGVVIGTPHYLSPEQAQGADNLDGRSDLYSLGATMYHLLTGRVPYTGTTPLEIVAQHLHGEVPDPAAHRPDLPPAGSALIRRMLAKSPDDRFRSAAELLGEIRRLRRASAPFYARRGAIAAAAAGTAALALLALQFLFRTPEPPPPAPAAVARRVDPVLRRKKPSPLPLDPNLLARYPLGESASPSRDTVGPSVARWRGDVGSSENVPRPGAGDAPPARSSRFSRQGLAEYIELPSTPTLDAVNLLSYSLVAWVKPLSKPPANGTDTSFAILMKQGWHEGLCWTNRGIFVMHHVLEGTPPSFVSAGDFAGEPLAPNQWYHVVGVVDLGAAQVRCYVNGVLHGQRSAIPPGSRSRDFGSMPWRIGRADATPGSRYGYQMDGLIVDARIYKYALTDLEIGSLFSGRDRREILPSSGEIQALSGATLAAARGAAAPERGLVGRWRFDEQTGARSQDFSGAGNHGTLIHAPRRSLERPPVQDPNSRSIAFDPDQDQYIEVADSPSLHLTGSLTLSAWVSTRVRTDHQQGIIEKWDWSGTEARGGYFLRLSVENYVSFSVAPASGGAQGLMSVARVPLDVWVHLAGVYDAQARSAKVYINGRCAGSTSPVSPPGAGSQPLRIGSDYGFNRFSGLISDVRIYHRAISEVEVRSLAAGAEVPDPGAGPAGAVAVESGTPRAVLPVPEPGLVGYWKFDEESGSVAYDSSGQSLHGTYSNAPEPSRVVPDVRFNNPRSRSFAHEWGQHVEIQDAPALRLTGSFSLAAWVRPTAATEVQPCIIEKFEWDGLAARGGYSLRLYSGRQAALGVHPASGPGGSVATDNEERVPLGRWTHVAGVYESESRRARLYLNGVLKATQDSVSPPAASAAPLRIGADYANNRFCGQIDDVRIYARALSPEELARLAGGSERAGESRR